MIPLVIIASQQKHRTVCVPIDTRMYSRSNSLSTDLYTQCHFVLPRRFVSLLVAQPDLWSQRR